MRRNSTSRPPYGVAIFTGGLTRSFLFPYLDFKFPLKKSSKLCCVVSYDFQVEAEYKKIPFLAKLVNGADQVANKLVHDHLSFFSSCALHAVVKEDVAAEQLIDRKISRHKKTPGGCPSTTFPIHNSQGAPPPR